MLEVASEMLHIRKTAPWTSAFPRAKEELLNNQFRGDALLAFYLDIKIYMHTSQKS